MYQTQAGLGMENGMGQESLEVMTDSKGCWIDSFPRNPISWDLWNERLEAQ